MFIGRKSELAFLNDCYDSPNAEFVVLYGRRRVGKTETLAEFCKGKPNVFYTCRELTDKIQLSSFSEKFTTNTSLPQLFGSFSDWDNAFSYIGSIKSEEKFVIVIDEFPYMCKNNKSIPSILQVAWDTNLRNKNIMLIICGSSMSFIEKELLSEKNPLYGRTTGIYKMLPMPYYDAIKFLPDYSDEDKLIAYSILGGIPHYLRQFNPKLSLEKNIKNKILTKGTVLYNEIEFLLRQELREASVYNTVIEAIAVGNSSFNDILTKTQLEKTKLSVYIKSLIELNIVEREFPVLSTLKERTSGNKGLYQLTDNYFRFWYFFIYGNLSFLEVNDIQSVWGNFIYSNLHNFASKAFENVCIAYMYELNKQRKLPFPAANIGRWWGKVNKVIDEKIQSTSEEIDVFVTDKTKTNYIIGECKFTNEKIDNGILEQLKLKYPNAGNVTYYLFSLNGFTKTLIDRAQKEQNIKLISLNDILNN